MSSNGSTILTEGVDIPNIDCVIVALTGGKGAFTQWVWVELIESSETIRLANTHQVHAEFI